MYRVVTELCDYYAGNYTHTHTHTHSYMHAHYVQTFTPSLDKNHVVYLDNFFTSIKLVEDLELKKIFCVGTIRTNKLGATPELVDKETLRKMERGEYLWRAKRNTAVTVWKDNKEIHLISNAYPVSGDVTVPRKRKTDGVVEQVSCPPALPGYNKYMGGVDQSDQKKSYCAISRKSRRWWLRIFWHFLDIAVVNAHWLYIANRQRALHPPLLPQPAMDVMAFRAALIHVLCDDFTARKPTGRPPTTAPSRPRPLGQHRLVHVSTLEMAKGRCQHCSVTGCRRSSQVGRPPTRRETYFACSVCHVRLCKTPCYDSFIDSYRSTLLAQHHFFISI